MLQIVDADGHLDEIPEEIVEYFDPPLKGHAVIGRGHGLFPSWASLKNRARTYLGGEGYSPYRDDPTPERWLAFADRAGIEQAMLYPTGGLGFGALDDPTLAVYIARAYNAWAYNRYMQPFPRLRCVGLLPWQNVPAAVDELKRIHGEFGMTSVVMHSMGLPTPLGDPIYWPVFEAAQDLGVFIGVHAGGTSRSGEFTTGLPSFARGMLNHPIRLMVELTSLTFEGVFERFPNLKMGFLEAGCGWLPYMLDRLDEKWESEAAARRKLGKRPSDCLRDSPTYFPAEPYEATIPEIIRRLGADHVFFATDFPHEADEEGRIEHIDAMRGLTSVSETDKQRILRDNALRAYSLAPLATAV